VTAAVLALAMGGCRASASANLNTGKKAEDDEDNGPVEPTEAEPPPADYALLGARHDVRLAADKKTPICSCLAVGLGAPADASFTWDGPPPAIDPQEQLVVAISSDGIACAGAKEGSLGASYWGYRQSGDDIVVIVENSHAGRPVTAGAIIPKPYGAGQVYVKAAAKSVPYGRPLVAGEKLCKIGNPGPTRKASEPAAPEESSD
jgi:hypothetical protein